jgi:hypothetical protein
MRSIASRGPQAPGTHGGPLLSASRMPPEHVFGSLVAIRLEDVHLDGEHSWVDLVQVKNDRPYRVPLGPMCQQAAMELLALWDGSPTLIGRLAAFTVNSNTQITTSVPSGAVTGKIVVKTAAGSASSSTKFTVT